MADVEFLTGPSGGMRIYYKGYMYNLDRDAKSGRKYWRCVNKMCKGRLCTLNEKVQHVRTHNHGSTPRNIVAHEIRTPLTIEPKDMSSDDEKSETLKQETTNLKIPRNNTILNVVCSTASSLSDAIRLTPSTSWPEVVDVLQRTINDISEFLTSGGVSHVDLVPMQSRTQIEGVLTLRDLVVTDVLDERATISSMIRPCSVVVDRISGDESSCVLPNSGFGETDLMMAIKKENDGDLPDVQIEDDEQQSETTTVSEFKPHKEKKAKVETYEENVAWFSDDQDDESDHDTSWSPRKGKSKPRSKPRKQKTPKRNSKRNSTQSTPESLEAAFDKYVDGNRYTFLQNHENYELETSFDASTNSECFFCEPNERYKCKSLSDFVKHLERAEHVDLSKHGYRSFDCPICDDIIRGRMLNRGGSDAQQTLRLVGRVTQHMSDKHGFKPDKKFIPIYNCQQCNKKFYSDINFTDHCRTVHRNVFPMDTQWENVSNDVVNDNFVDNSVEERTSIYQSDGPDKVSFYKPFGTPLYDQPLPLFGTPESEYNSTQLIVRVKHGKNLDAPFKAGVEALCPFCPAMNHYNCKNLKDLLSHMKEADHFFTVEGQSTSSLKCPMCESVSTHEEQEGCDEETLLLQVIGRVIHHMIEKHEYTPERNFLPTYECKGCNTFFFSQEKCQVHMVKVHMYEAKSFHERPVKCKPKGKGRPGAKTIRNPYAQELPKRNNRNNRMLLITKYENYDISAPFKETADTRCPFCPDENEFRCNNLSEFINHVIEKEHINLGIHGYREMKCPQCDKSLRNRNLEMHGTPESQILRLVGKIIQHMINGHDYVPDPNFLHSYKCDICFKKFYCDRSFLEHLRLVHRKTRKQLASEGGNPQSLSTKEAGAEEGQSLEDGAELTKDIIQNASKVRNRFIIAALYEKYDLDEDFPANINNTCPFCPKEKVFEFKNLRHALDHLQEFKHVAAIGFGLRSLKCSECTVEMRNRIKKADGTNEAQIMRLLGKMVQHMSDNHGYDLNNTFVPRYFCDRCFYKSFNCGHFLDHLIRVHMSRISEDSYPTNNEHKLFPKTNIDAKKIVSPESELDFEKRFDSTVDCMFCETANMHPLFTLGEFVQHVEKKHMEIEDDTECSVKCPNCFQEFYGSLPDENELKNGELLQVISRAIQHMYAEHDFRFAENFPPKFKCGNCDYFTYSGFDLNIHKQQFHSTQKTREVAFADQDSDGGNDDNDAEDDVDADLYTSDVYRLQLTEDVYESVCETMMTLDLPLIKTLDPACPICSDKSVKFITFGDMIDHWKKEAHAVLNGEQWEMKCSDCETTVQIENYAKDNEAANYLSIIGKWIVHRFTTHEWAPPPYLPQYRCTICKFSDYDPRECTRHMKGCLQEQPKSGTLQCPVCKTMKPVDLYRQHVKRCSKNADLTKKQCKMCRKMISVRHLSGHEKMCSKPKDQYKRTPCPICGKLLLDEMHYHKSNLRKHIMICHTDVFPHLCSVCSMQFKRRNDLNRHMFQFHGINISNSQTPKYCDQCDYKTLSKTHLMRHLTTHRKSTDVTCDKCGKQYKSIYHLNAHLRTTHKRKEQLETSGMFECTQCSYTTPVRSYFTKHLRYHRDMKTGAGHWCTICNYNARFPIVLKNHMRNVHKIDITKAGANGSTMFKSAPEGRLFKNMRLPGETKSRSDEPPILPTVGKLVRTKKRGRLAQSEKELALEGEEEEEAVGEGEKPQVEIRQNKKYKNLDKGNEMNPNSTIASGIGSERPIANVREGFNGQDNLSLPTAIPASGLAMGEVGLEGINAMMHPANANHPHIQPQTSDAPGNSGNEMYNINQPGYAYGYNFPNMYY